MISNESEYIRKQIASWMRHDGLEPMVAVPRRLIEFAPAIGFFAVAVYVVIASRADEGRESRVSAAYIADVLNCSKRSVIRCIKRLVNSGLIQKRRRYDLAGAYRANAYILQ